MEITYPASAITVKQTLVFENKLGIFTYCNIKEDLYLGFAISDYMGIPFFRAIMAKAFLIIFITPLEKQRTIGEL